MLEGESFAPRGKGIDDCALASADERTEEIIRGGHVYNGFFNGHLHNGNKTQQLYLLTFIS